MKSFLTLLWVCILSSLLHTTSESSGNEIQFVEDFVLATDRAKTLEQLVPGTDGYYFYQCLHLQNTEQYDAVSRLLNTWRQRHGDTPSYQEIRNRHMLLTYSKNPKQSIDYLISKLSPKLNHQREQLQSKPKLASKIDPKLTDFETIKKRLLRQNNGLNGFSDPALLLLRADDLNAGQRRQLLSRFSRPNHPQLIEMILDDLQYKGSKGFGSHKVHSMLTIDQLEELSDRRPPLRNETKFVHTYLQKLQPSTDVDIEDDPKEKDAYLQRVWQFVKELDPAHNSVKAHVLYRWLEFDEQQGRYNKQRFTEYIQLPRSVHYVEPKFMATADARRHPVDLNLRLSCLPLNPIGQDEPLVRRYLLHFFQRDANYRAYSQYIKDDFLKQVFAEAKITTGQGNPEKWYSMISPNQYQALKDRVDIDFAATNPDAFRSNDDVQLKLNVKNVKKLIVKIYEVNTENFYRDQGREVNTDIQLDGLIANEEFTYEYNDSPFIRKERTFDFPQLKEAGIYVVDFIGNGKSSRAVIRKGQLSYLVQTVPEGHLFQVLDDQQNVLMDTSLWMAGQHYTSEKDGTILVPFSTRPGRQPIVLSHGNQASLQYFNHQKEAYKFRVAIHVDRESMLERKETAILLRSELLLNNSPVSPELLKDVTVTVTTTNLDGVTSSKQFEDVKLSESQETPIEIAVPSRLHTIKVDVTGQITSNRNAIQRHTASHQVSINEIDRTDKIEDVHLSKIGSQFMLQLLGKTGEPRAYRALTLALAHRAFKQPIKFQLATNENGFVELGNLQDIFSVSVSSPTANSKTWPLLGDRRTQARSLHVLAGKPVQIPHMQSDDAESMQISLYELRGSSYATDLTDAVNIEDSYLKIDKLTPGDYSLLIGPERTNIRVTKGKTEAGFAVGDLRRLEMRKLDPIQISDVVTNDKEVKIQITDHNEFARVHVYATRFYPAFDVFDAFGQIQEVEPVSIRAPQRRSLYMSGRKLGDELQYVLDRSYATKFPGNMLTRPSLLLNSWPVSDTQTSTQQAQDGEEFDDVAENQPAADAMRRARQQRKAVGQTDFANLDFLELSSTLLANLKPDENGTVTVSVEDLKGHQHLHIVAVDPMTTVYRSIARSDLDTKHRDLRLVDGLDSSKHYMQQKVTSLLTTGEKFELADITTASFDAYDSLERVYDLYATASNNQVLAKFQFVVDWPNLSSDEKREKYSEFASHELNFFLFKKDPDFFNEVVRPYLENKHHKTFVDLWLLDTDLSSFLQPWNFAQLNTVERLLLGERFPGETEMVRRLLADQLAMIPIDVSSVDRYFDLAISGRALSLGRESESFGLVKQQRGLMRQKKSASRDSGLGSAPGQATRRFSSMRFEENVEDESIVLNESLDKLDGAVAVDQKARLSALSAPSAYFAGGAVTASDSTRGRGRQLYEQLDKTKEWAENNYYQLPIARQVANLVSPGTFWLDYAKRPTGEPFFSIEWPSANRNFTEMMFALSVLDLPFKAGEHKSEFEDQHMTLTAASPMVIFHQQIQETDAIEEESPILIKQNYFRANDRYKMVQGQRRDKFVTEEFLTHVVYGCQIVLTNPTSSARQVQVLEQIPHMAIATNGGKATNTVKLNLEPYHTQTLEYFFYFPNAGDYDHFPAHVSEDEALLGHASPATMKVVETLSKVDEASWDYVSQFAENDDVVDFLNKNSLLDINLSKIAFRMSDKKFFVEVTQLLDKRHVYNHDLWAYGLKHKDASAIATYLKHSNGFLSRCGKFLSSDLVDIEPVKRKTFQHLDYKPLVNARAHQLGSERQILNNRFYQQYHNLLDVLKYRAKLTSEDRLVLTYYLLLQDRIEEAINTFKETDRSEFDSKLQYDYFAAYLDCYQDDPTVAREIVTKYTDYPVPKWQLAFANIKSMLAELDGEDVLVTDPKDRTQTQLAAATEQPGFDFLIEGQQLLLDYQNVDEVQVHYYLVDLELLFSRNPFVQNFDGQFAHIRPNSTQTVSLAGDKAKHAFELPEELKNRNVLVEIKSNGITRTQFYFSNSLNVQMSENYGQLKVVETKTGKTMPKTYVKVYATTKGGEVKFYKDGYTDLRGRFDYASLSTNELDSVDRFSILVLDDALGGLVREAKPPKQ